MVRALLVCKWFVNIISSLQDWASVSSGHDSDPCLSSHCPATLPPYPLPPLFEQRLFPSWSCLTAS